MPEESKYNALHLEALEHNQFLIDDMEEMYYENQLEIQEEQEQVQAMCLVTISEEP